MCFKAIKKNLCLMFLENFFSENFKSLFKLHLKEFLQRKTFANDDFMSHPINFHQDVNDFL
jgi:hypothetical protein